MRLSAVLKARVCARCARTSEDDGEDQRREHQAAVGFPARVSALQPWALKKCVRTSAAVCRVPLPLDPLDARRRTSSGAGSAGSCAAARQPAWRTPRATAGDAPSCGSGVASAEAVPRRLPHALRRAPAISQPRLTLCPCARPNAAPRCPEGSGAVARHGRCRALRRTRHAAADTRRVVNAEYITRSCAVSRFKHRVFA